MDISVVIPAGPAAHLVIQTQLDALSRQAFTGAWEVIIANNGSDGGALNELAEQAAGKLDLKVVDALQGVGAGYARNIGGWYASADRLAFCDADDVVEDGWLSAIVEGLEDNSFVTGAVGRVPFEAIKQSSPQELFATTQFSEAAPEYRGFAYASGNNCAFRREAIPEGYAADYIPVAWDDEATSLRARVAGHRLGWCPRARILYRGRPKGNPTFRRAISSGVGQRKLDREFEGVLWPDRGAKLIRRTGWLVANAPRLASPGFRETWRWEAGATLGVALEHVLPGVWAGMFSTKPQRARALVADADGGRERRIPEP
jgi:glycosyltransferase involved in cell wall biosynthesis